MLKSLDHVVIAVRDLDAATATYGKLLGRAPSWRGTHPGAGTANTLFRLERTYAELLSPVGRGPLADALRAHLAGRGEGPFALAFGTDDAGACAARLRACGLSPSDPIDGHGRDALAGAVRAWRTVPLPTADTRGVQLFAIEHRSPPAALPPAAAVDAGSAVYGIDHVVIMTADADAAAVLYRDRLGLRLAFDRRFEERRVRLLFFRVGGVTVELAAPLASATDAALPDRFWGISWRVPDVDAARGRLAASGFDVSEARQGHRPGTRVCTVRAQTHGVATLLIGPAPTRSPASLRTPCATG
jgi:catechol 2,3-dioxygenase-like lactoylglutathione lyase family enzyme